MILGLSACIGTLMAVFFTLARTSSKTQHPPTNKLPWNGGWLDRVLTKSEIWLQSVERLPTITPNISSRPPNESLAQQQKSGDP